MDDADISKLKIDRSVKKENQARRRSPRYGKIAVAIVAVIAIMAVYVVIFHSAVTVETTTVSQIYPSQTFTTLNASGYIVAQRKAAVASKVTARLIALNVEEGSRIKKGEIIARLENEDVRAGYDQAIANYAVARHNLEQARAELQDAGINFRRAKELVTKGFIAKSDYDSANARFLKAQAGVAAAEAGVKANAAAVEASKTAIEYTLIRAPFDAVVLTKNADVGDIVTPIGAAANAKSSVVTIADMESLQVEADVSESNVAKVKMGQPCEIQLDAIPERRFRGEVHMIVPTADRNKASIMVKVKFIDKDKRVLPDMTAKVAFLSRPIKPGEETPRTGVLQAALVQRQGATVVYQIKNGTVFERPVKTGEQFGDLVEITSGAQPGEKLVLNPTPEIKSGSRVKTTGK